MFETIVKPGKQIKRNDAIARIMVIEDMLHQLMRDCDVSGMKDTANAIDNILSFTDGVYTAICEGD